MHWSGGWLSPVNNKPDCRDMPLPRIPWSCVVVGVLCADIQSLADVPSEVWAPVPAWDVSLPDPLVNVAPAESVAPAPLAFPEIICSHTTGQFVVEAPPVTGVPPVAGRINVTMQVVAAPDLPDPPPQLAALSPDAPAVQAQVRELLGTHQRTERFFVSATVYDHHRTFVRIYPNARVDEVVGAWSNLDFNVFNGWSTYRVTNNDGISREVGLLMGVSNFQTAAMQTLAARSGTAYYPPSIPALPELIPDGPAFQVVEGDAESPAMDTLQQIHELFRNEGERLASTYLARKEAEAERKAALLADPPVPNDVTIRYWKGEPDAKGTEVAE